MFLGKYVFLELDPLIAFLFNLIPYLRFYFQELLW